MYKVSVIIPVYNAEKYLRTCLDSVAEQSLKEIEIICVDDESTDSSVRIVEEYAEKYASIRLIRRKNGGTSAARNTGLDIAAGEYVCFLDNDDALDPQALEKLYRVATQEALDVLYFNGRTLFENDRMQENFANLGTNLTRPGDYSGICTGQTMFARMYKDSKYLPQVWIQMFRRAFLEEKQIRFYEGITYEDNLFTFRCAMTAQRVDYIPDEFYIRCVRDGSIVTSPKTIYYVESYLVSYCEMLNLLRELPLQADAAVYIQEYLYHSLFRNGCAIWKSLPEEEKGKALTRSGVDAAQMLLLVGKLSEQEERGNRLKARNALLREKLKASDEKLKASNAQLLRLQKRNPIDRIKRFFRTVKEHGPGYTLRKAAAKVSRVFAALMRRA